MLLQSFRDSLMNYTNNDITTLSNGRQMRGNPYLSAVSCQASFSCFAGSKVMCGYAGISCFLFLLFDAFASVCQGHFRHAQIGTSIGNQLFALIRTERFSILRFRFADSVFHPPVDLAKIRVKADRRLLRRERHFSNRMSFQSKGRIKRTWESPGRSLRYSTRNWAQGRINGIPRCLS